MELTSSIEKMNSQLRQLEKEKSELLTDNQRMAEILSSSEGDSQKVTEILERLTEERRSLQRECQQLKENGIVELTLCLTSSGDVSGFYTGFFLGGRVVGECICSCSYSISVCKHALSRGVPPGKFFNLQPLRLFLVAPEITCSLFF